MPSEFINPAYIDPGTAGNVAMFLGMAAEGATAKVAAEAISRGNAITLAVSGEASARSAAIAAESATRLAADTAATTSRVAEASTRAAADAALNTALATEVATRATADAAATTALANEAAVRASADNALTIKINADIATEANTRATADASLTAKINADVLAEATARTAADAALSVSIAALSQAGESMTIGTTAPVNAVVGVTQIERVTFEGYPTADGTGYFTLTRTGGAPIAVEFNVFETEPIEDWATRLAILLNAHPVFSPYATASAVDDFLYITLDVAAANDPLLEVFVEDDSGTINTLSSLVYRSGIAPIAATLAPPYLRVAGGFLYIREAGVWKKAALSAL